MNNVININRNRQPEGTPAGGQFAASTHGEATGVSLGRHAAEPDSIPETLLMGHVQDPQLVSKLGWAVECASNYGTPDHYRDTFAKTVPNLSRGEAEELFYMALDSYDAGQGYEAFCREAADRDTAAHPGGQIDPGYTPPGHTESPGRGQGITRTGDQYNGFRDAAEVAADIRADLKTATAANYLPKGLAYSVKTDKYAGGQSIRVSVRGIPDADRLSPTEKDHWGDPAEREEAKQLRARLEEMVNVFNQEDTSNFSNSVYHGFVDLESDSSREFREEEAEKRKLKRQARKG